MVEYRDHILSFEEFKMTHSAKLRLGAVALIKYAKSAREYKFDSLRCDALALLLKHVVDKTHK